MAGSIANAKLANSVVSFEDASGNTSDIALGGTVRIGGTTNEVEVGYSSGVYTIGLPSTITAAVSGNATSATALATARNIGITAGPVRAANISFDGSGNVAMTSSIAADQITNAMLANDKLVIQVGGTDFDRELGSTLKFAKGGDLTINYSASENEITYALPSSISSDTSGNAGTATALETARNFEINAGPVRAAAVSFDGTGNLQLTSSIANDQITNAMLANPGILFGDGSTPATHELGKTVVIQGTSNECTVSASHGAGGPTFTVGLPDTIAAALTGNADTASALATARAIQISGDVAGTANFDGSAAINISSTIQSGAVENSMLANSTFTVSDGSNTSTIALGGTLTVQGTSNEIEVGEDAGTYTIGLPNSVNVTSNLDVGGNLTLSGAAIITGNITASGQLSASGANISFADTLIEFGVNNTGTKDHGFYSQRASGSFCGFVFDESDDKFKVFVTDTEPSTTVDTSQGGFAKGDFEANTIAAASTLSGALRSTGSAPASASASGTAGDIRFDSGKIYVCVATNTWKAADLSTF